jgi:hypothetical protein
MIHIRMLGITRRMLNITRPKSPKVEVCGTSAGWTPANEEFMMSVTLAGTGETLLAARAAEFAASMAVTGDCM